MIRVKAVVLLSGGLDSATTLYYARAKGNQAFSLTFDYGQRHKRELVSAGKLAGASGSRFRLLKISLPWKGSSLLDKSISLPKGMIKRCAIPNTYVPGRNIIFLSYATSYAESIGAQRIFIGANQIDYSGYPDCRMSFFRAFGKAVNRGTRTGIEKDAIRIEAPFINKTKADIIKAAFRLKVPLEYTWSCYKGGKAPCGRCDSCLIRGKGFKEAGFKDPLLERK